MKLPDKSGQASANAESPRCSDLQGKIFYCSRIPFSTRIGVVNKLYEM